MIPLELDRWQVGPTMYHTVGYMAPDGRCAVFCFGEAHRAGGQPIHRSYATPGSAEYQADLAEAVAIGRRMAEAS